MTQPLDSNKHKHWGGRVFGLLLGSLMLSLQQGKLAWSIEAESERALAATNKQTIQLDILSVGSSDRRDLFDAQTQTFAQPNTGYVRNVYWITEDDDSDQACRDGTLTSEHRNKAFKFCKEQYLWNKTATTTDFMRRNVGVKNGRLFQGKASPQWLCAQKRFPLGLAKVVKGYKNDNDNISLPDYLLMVDDDTWFDIDKLVSHVLVWRQNPNKPYVGAGCKVTKKTFGPGIEVVVFYGGAGLLLSKGSLERLLRPLEPLHSDNTQSNENNWTEHAIDQPDLDDWETQVQSALHNNLAFEKDLFHPGMSVMDLIESYSKAEAFDNVEQWTRGFCFHSDNFLSYFIENYRIHETQYLEALIPQVWSHDEWFTFEGVWMHRGDRCPKDSMICHYVLPQEMHALQHNKTSPVLGSVS